jgi:hypothetical protein
MPEAEVAAPIWNREGLLRDSEATLREVASLLGELWESPREVQWGAFASEPDPEGQDPHDVINRILSNTHREVQTLKEGIGALRELLPDAVSETGRRRFGDAGFNPEKGAKARRASEILMEVQARLDLLSENTESRGPGMG